LGENNPKLKILQTTLNMKEYALSNYQNKMEFLREPTNEDREYRFDILDNWPRKVSKTVPSNLPLRFHGCPIYTAKKILYVGGLSASSDRLGFDTSYDASGQVSVSTAENIEITTRSYTDLSAENFTLPAGVIFVLIPKNELDAQASASLLMGNVNFKESPNRLFAIVSTPENTERLKEWAKWASVPESKINTFDSFLKRFVTQTETNNIKE
jgi:hypothetical protein